MQFETDIMNNLYRTSLKNKLHQLRDKMKRRKSPGARLEHTLHPLIDGRFVEMS
jgi:hypothetical protein